MLCFSPSELGRRRVRGRRVRARRKRSKKLRTVLGCRSTGGEVRNHEIMGKELIVFGDKLDREQERKQR